MPPCLTLSIIKYRSSVKWSNPGKGVEPSSTPWCSKLSKREPSGNPRLWSTYIYMYVLNNSHYGTKNPESDLKMKIYNESLSRGKIYILEKKKLLNKTA